MKEIGELGKWFADSSELTLSMLFKTSERLAEEDKRHKVSLVSFLSSEDPVQLLQERQTPDYSLSYETLEDFHLYELSRTIRRSSIEGGERVVQGKFGLFKNEDGNMWTAFSSESPDFFHLGMLGLLRENRPQVTRIFLSSEELRHIFEEIEADHNWKIFVRKGVLYSHHEEGSIIFRKGHFQALFNKAENENGYVDKVEFETRDENNHTRLHGFMSREGVFYFHGGKLEILTDVILPKVSAISNGKKQKLEKRERKFGDLALNPIELVFPEDRFSNKADNEAFVAKVSRISGTGLSVYHLNPYLHIKLLDFIDGSRFDIVAVSSDRMRIVPAFRSSVHSLMRISDGIFRTFDEAIIEEVEKDDYSLEDFVGGP